MIRRFRPYIRYLQPHRGLLGLAILCGIIAGVAVWRGYENTFQGVQVYVDDLVTDENRRSTGVGHALIDGLAERARTLGATALTLDSGTQRRDAHRFYLRERFDITSFHFNKSL